MDDHVVNFTGSKFNVFNPRPEDVNIADIAHALSMICRYNGHTDRFYTVAEHCVVASLCGPPENALPILLHDSPEAYMKDIVDPHKVHFTTDYVEKEMEILMTILVGLQLDGFSDGDWAAIKEADMRMRATERDQLLKRSGHMVHIPEGCEPYDVKLACLDPRRAKIEFIERFKALGGLRGQKNKLVYREEREDGVECGQTICPFHGREHKQRCEVTTALPTCESYVPVKECWL